MFENVHLKSRQSLWKTLYNLHTLYCFSQNDVLNNYCSFWYDIPRTYHTDNNLPYWLPILCMEVLIRRSVSITITNVELVYPILNLTVKCIINILTTLCKDIVCEEESKNHAKLSRLVSLSAFTNWSSMISLRGSK